MNENIEIGVIGGSGLYRIESLTDPKEIKIETPYGNPADTFHIGTIAGKRVAFLPRFGRKHQFLPHEVPYKANIYGFKKLGVKWLISVSAVGSLQEEIQPGHFVFPDQFLDRTKQPGEKYTFFGNGLVAHVAFGEPVSNYLRTVLYQSATIMGAHCHWDGTYVNIEGPIFSTRAESEIYRKLGATVIGMTNAPEAKLAREAEIAYAPMTLVTDYDSWHKEEVSSTSVLEVLKENIELAQKVLVHAIKQLQPHMHSEAHTVLSNAFFTPKEEWPKKRVEELGPILTRILAEN